ncbi:MAG TPA: hypothetical protein DDZ51_31120 [Planctomycetaceae bacterium]|nr:hypothetical protein [Planctomycetaceae bacterium]
MILWHGSKLNASEVRNGCQSNWWPVYGKQTALWDLGVSIESNPAQKSADKFSSPKPHCLHSVGQRFVDIIERKTTIEDKLS